MGRSEAEEVANLLVAQGLQDVTVGAGNVLHTRMGKVFFKVGTGGAHADLAMLEYESEGLSRMGKAAPSLRIPNPILVGTLASGASFIAMDYINQQGRTGTDVQRKLGQGLAEMHLAPAEHPVFGFPMDGCCGAAPQLNNVDRRSLDWVDFWREFRLGHQLKLARDNHPHNQNLQESGVQLMKRLPELFSMIHTEDIQPSLLHGDLWSGNYSADEDGRPCIFDPACYYGHHEADHGIAHMFGGFSSVFFSSYHDVIPKQPGYDDRAVLYELHHHLNHYNIFGGGYGSSALDLIRRLNSRKHL